MNTRKKYYISTFFLVLLLLLLTIGYAYLSQTLNINGASSINNTTWNIYFDNIEVNPDSVAAEEPVIDTNKTAVTYDITLSNPGDFYEFTVDAVNAGSIDAMIESISSKLNNVEITTLPNYLEYSITYSDGVEIQENQLLSSGTTEKYKIKVGYKKDISESDMPTTEQNINIDFQIIYKQSDSNAVAISHPVPASNVLVVNPDGATPAEKSPYVNYTYGNNQTILTRVLYDASSPYGVQIVSNNSVKDVTIGRYQSDYNDALLILNSASGEYLNEHFADRTRCLGSSPDSSATTEGPSNMFYAEGYHGGDGRFKDTDELYLNDYNQIVLLNIDKVECWLASREVYLSSSYRAAIRSMNSASGLSIFLDNRVILHLYTYKNFNGETVSNYTVTTGYRPVIHLKPETKVIGGSGTEDNPYILG